MSDTDTPRSRQDILADYWDPDPSVIERREQGGVTLSYVSHVLTQHALDEIDPNWTWQPATDATGAPLITKRPYKQVRRDGTTYASGEILTLWGSLTLLGVVRWGVGSCDASKPEAEKELIGDFIRNAAMRHGVFASLWLRDAVKGSGPQRPAPSPVVPLESSDIFAARIRARYDDVDTPGLRLLWAEVAKAEIPQHLKETLHSELREIAAELSGSGGR